MGNKKPWDDRRVRLQSMLRELRVEAGLNQKELAERLGSDQSFVSRFERGERRLDLIELQEICEACSSDIKQLLKKYSSASPISTKSRD